MLTSRRTFVQMAAAGLAMAAPSDRIRVGFIGLGGQGTSRLNEFLRHPDVDAAAVCDVDAAHVDRAAEIVTRARGQAPAKFHDFRKLLELKDLDAVMIATPDHWHALPTILACQAGKDVFVEKPLCYSIGEGRAMVAAARRHDRITQMGNHIHNDLPNYRRVVEVIQSGALGKIHRVDCSLADASKPLGKPADTAPPAGLDYDFWLGPAPKRPYNPLRSHFTYRYFWDYSGGYLIDFWCHYTDVVHWALNLPAPHSVSASGGRWAVDDLAETPDILEVVCHYPDLLLTWTLHPNGRPGFDHMGSSVIFEGSAATLVTNYNRYEVYVKGKRDEGFKPPAPSIPDSPGHIREFLDAIKSRRRTTCDIEYGYLLTKGGLLANIAYRTGERLYWDDAHERFTGHTDANRYVTRRYRKPWKLPV
ncbi:MAG TPA: Gfo/Idh/MocA family oxidoreductase [Verrucomicrobiae bacterium]|nr:Gfo/Idh/MocA family oxidoreductase [Verrucomicrobiae bacterium]